MGFFGRLFVPLFVVLAAVGGWLVVESEQGTIYAIDEPEGALAPAAGPRWGRREGAAPPATAQTAAERPARERFARPFDRGDARPRVAVIVTGLGLTRDVSFRAIEDLPGEVTLAFSPYAENLPPLIARARVRGHEILVAAPMEPADVKRRDAGPAALTVSHAEGATRQRLAWMLERVPSHVGIVGDLGDRFARDPVAMKPVLDELAAKGLLYVENRLESRESTTIGNGVPMAAVTVWLDRELSGEAIDREIAAAEAQAKRGGSIVVLTGPYPAALSRVTAWMKTFDRKSMVAAPISAVAKGGS
ncbi:MAG TPA: divergent polysaccharide deacetylase family protein [Alphaproteobacteria bacterium]